MKNISKLVFTSMVFGLFTGVIHADTQLNDSGTIINDTKAQINLEVVDTSKKVITEGKLIPSAQLDIGRDFNKIESINISENGKKSIVKKCGNGHMENEMLIRDNMEFDTLTIRKINGKYKVKCSTTKYMETI